MLLLTACSAVGAWLAAVGLFGLMSFTVSTRTREIGVRLALGARPSRVVRMVLGTRSAWSGSASSSACRSRGWRRA